jgi:hypothetical protein
LSQQKKPRPFQPGFFLSRLSTFPKGADILRISDAGKMEAKQRSLARTIQFSYNFPVDPSWAF